MYIFIRGDICTLNCLVDNKYSPKRFIFGKEKVLSTLVNRIAFIFAITLLLLFLENFCIPYSNKKVLYTFTSRCERAKIPV